MKSIVYGAILAAVAVLSGCASMGPKPPEEIVKERAQGRWDALVKVDVPGAYAFLSPASRSTVTLEGYKGSINPGFWKVATVEKVVCETPESCEAYASIEYDYRGTRIKTPLRESWIKDGSQWWYVYR